MSATDPLLRGARWRAAGPVLLAALPWWLLAAWWLRASPPFVHALTALLVLAFAAAWSLRRDRRWLARRLDRLPAFEDSAGLLFASPPGNVLASLQRERLHGRLAQVRVHDLGLHVPWRGLLLNAVLAASVAALLVQPRVSPETHPLATDAATIAPASPTVRQVRVEIEAPAYTGRAVETHSDLDLVVLEGSTLRWRLHLAPSPQRLALLFLDGTRWTMRREGADWTVVGSAERSTRYRLEADGAVLSHPPSPAHADSSAATRAPAHRIDVVADQAPRITVTSPTQTLTLIEQAGSIDFEAEAVDDFGLGAATLRITLAQGDGELVEVSERRVALEGSGDARSRRYRHRFDPAAFGFGPGDDLILRLEVADNRAPTPQTAQSASYILRWPRRRDSEGEGVEGLVQRAMPAYFRSQRQIIIDSEALLEARDELDADSFLARSDAIGVDQRILRLRYGEFLGEETEDAGSGLLPEGHSFDDGHGHVDPAAAYGDAQAVIDAFGHSHDNAEATTLFDPVTRERLRAALGEMWQSELHLRQGDPGRALPYQHRALDLIKQIQQSSRIYLARVGLALPPIDFGRRLSGDVAGVTPRSDPLPPAKGADAGPRAAWNVLGGDDPAAALPMLAAWLEGRDDAGLLDLIESLDRARRDPECAACLDDLRAALWPHLAAPAQQPVPRPHPDAGGRAWLRALEERP